MLRHRLSRSRRSSRSSRSSPRRRVALARRRARRPEPDPSDPFFDDTVLHDIRLSINTRDWESLKVHYLDNTYYPC